MRLAGGRFPKRLSLSLRRGPPLTPPRGLSELTARSASTSKITTPRKGDAGVEQSGGGSTSGNSGAGALAGAPGPTKTGVYAGGAEMPFTSRLHIADPSKAPVSDLLGLVWFRRMYDIDYGLSDYIPRN